MSHKVFDSDFANDIRTQYTDALRRGEDSCNVTQQLIIDYDMELLDDDDAPIFWLSLADVQWDMGRLEETVKCKALDYIEKELDQLTDQSSEMIHAEMKTNALTALRNKLSSAQPPKKQIRQYRLYHTDWKIGDVFAYRLSSDDTDHSDYHDMYMYFIVKDTDIWHPGHTIPVVYVYWTISEQLLSLDQIQQYEYLPQFYKPVAYKNNPGLSMKYSLALIFTSARTVPKKRLTYLGNMEEVRLIDGEDPNAYHVGWKNFDKYMIENYLSWYNPKMNYQKG